MKKVAICNFSKDSKGYKIYIDSDHQYYFSNKKEVQRTFVLLNDYFTKTLVFLNESYSEIFKLYRNQYFIIENPFINHNIKKEFQLIESSIDLILGRSSWENGNYFTVKHIENIYSSMFSILLHLRESCKKRSDTPNIYSIEVKKDLLTIYYKNFMDVENLLNKSNLDQIETAIKKITA